MVAVDWDEVKRLAADFQKVQLSSTLQKLSERNCIEIVTTLIRAKLLDVIFTNDGKEYITPQHLCKEIKDELYVHGGRINLVELAKIVNVDLSQVSKAATEIERRDKGLKLILGQLVDKSYQTKITGEINDELNKHGYVNATDLTLRYDLPAEFLQKIIERELGKTVFGRQDAQNPRIFYTEGYVARNRAKVRGALSAITKPTPLSAILGQCSVPERVFFSILEHLQGTKQVPGVVTGKQSGNGIYVPTVYSKSQNEWVDNFYKQNGYLEYDALSRLGISDPRSFVKRHFSNDRLTLLDTVAVGTTIIQQVDANVEEAIATSSFTDVCPLLPSVFGPKDVELLLRTATEKAATNVHIFANTIVLSDAFLQGLTKPFELTAEKRAKESVDSGEWLRFVAEKKIKSRTMEIAESKLDRKEERRKKATGGKAGGGSQGRETKTKSTKKKYQRGKVQEFDSDEEQSVQCATRRELTLISTNDIEREIGRDVNLADVDGLVKELAACLQPTINKRALSIAEQLARTNKTINLNEMEEKLNMLLTNIRIFDKGIKHLDKTVQTAMTKYLLKTLGVDFTIDAFKLAARQNMIQCPDNLINAEARQRILVELPADVKEPLSNLHKTIAGCSIEDLLNVAESVLAACCLLIRKYDKKKERSLVVGHREALLEQLNATQEPALALHLVTSVLFTAITQNALYMSGRHVSSILSFLRPFLEPTTVSILYKYHDSVLKLLGSTNDEAKVEAQAFLGESLQEIKNIANDFKKHLKSDKSEN